MTTKIKGTEGVEFPDSTIQGSAAYTKAQMNAQSWQNLTASRAGSTDYVNNTTLPITVAVRVTAPVNNACGGIIRVNGAQIVHDLVTSQLTGSVVTCQCVVPVGARYNFEIAGGTINTWSELR
jgi:hypothetical protein